MMSSAPNPQSDADQLDAATDQAIAACGDDAREAVKALIVANHFLEAELEKLRAAVSMGYARGKLPASLGYRLKQDYPPWYDPDSDPSQFMAALWKVRHLCTRAEHVRVTVPGSHVLVQAIMSAIDDYAERETGNREYFWIKPHKAG